MPSVGKDQLDRPVGETARRLALAWLDEADDALERLSDPDDDEALHDFRVALRRFRSSLRAYRPYLKGSAPKKARRQMCDLASATNPGRDAEVAITWLERQADAVESEQRPGYNWLLRRLEAEKLHSYGEAQQRIARDFRDARRRVARRLSAYQVQVGDDAAPALRSFAHVTADLVAEHADELRALLATVHNPTDEDEAHNSRIAAKRLRYLIEPLKASVDGVKPLVKQLKQLQDILGDLHDAHVLTAKIAESMQLAAAERARQLHEHALDREPAGANSVPPEGDETIGLLAMTRLLRQRQDELFHDLATNWLGERSAPFFGAIAALTRHLRQGDGTYEIERKYLLRSVPDSISGAPGTIIEQGWLPGKTIQERLRRTRGPDGVRYFRTVKTGSGLKRLQLEETLSRRSFQKLWPLTEGRRLRKRRYSVNAGELTWEIDAFDALDLVIAEIELPSEDYAVELPEWLSPFVLKEVTGRPEYDNVRLARKIARRKALKKK